MKRCSLVQIKVIYGDCILDTVFIGISISPHNKSTELCMYGAIRNKSLIAHKANIPGKSVFVLLIFLFKRVNQIKTLPAKWKFKLARLELNAFVTEECCSASHRLIFSPKFRKKNMEPVLPALVRCDNNGRRYIYMACTLSDQIQSLHVLVNIRHNLGGFLQTTRRVVASRLERWMRWSIVAR